MSVIAHTGGEIPGHRRGTSQVTNVDSMSSETIHMETNDMHQFTGDNRWRVIMCLEGQVWITQEHDWRDYVLDPGDIFVISRSGKVLIEALCQSSVRITPSVRISSFAGRLRVFA